MGMKALELTGKVFGRLTVCSREPKKSKRTRWICTCICGAMVDVSTDNLIKGLTRSCGCLRKEIARKNGGRLKPQPDGLAAFNYLLYVYKVCAERRGLVFELTNEEFRSLTQGVCYYCGTPPSQTVSRRNSHYIHNGIDRHDNSQGYIKSNCVPCCSTCNSMKSTRSANEFVNHCVRVANWNED